MSSIIGLGLSLIREKYEYNEIYKSNDSSLKNIFIVRLQSSSDKIASKSSKILLEKEIKKEEV